VLLTWLGGPIVVGSLDGRLIAVGWLAPPGAPHGMPLDCIKGLFGLVVEYEWRYGKVCTWLREIDAGMGDPPPYEATDVLREYEDATGY